jgi:hypothetical protein
MTRRALLAVGVAMSVCLTPIVTALPSSAHVPTTTTSIRVAAVGRG